jgi:tetratricopeptide (TPR) repeat protein
MNQKNPQPERDGDADVAETNVERLVSKAYCPEQPTPAFTDRVTQAMAAEAAQRRPQGVHRPTSLAVRVTTWAVAASILLALGVALGHLLTTARPDRDPNSDQIAGEGVSTKPIPRLVVSRSPKLARNWPAASVLTPRRRTESTKIPKLAVGDSLQTSQAERRRAELPDGSTVYLNRNTALTLDARRRISLDRGEIYLDVAPQYGEQAGDQPDGAESQRFVVVTPDRELISLGTKFNVRSRGDNGTSIAVTQGKVKVSGIEVPLEAGQQLLADDEVQVVPIGQTFHLIDWTRQLVTSHESPLVPASDYAGGALVAKRPDGQETSLSMRRYKVDVHIEDGFARTTIDQTYFNHETWRLEGTFFFPLPPDASLSRLAMYVNGQLMEGGMAEREHARRTFEEIVRTQKDPALLEWIDGSTFRMRVFPLEGRQEKRIVLSYTQRLQRHGDRVEYRFPGGHNMSEVGQWSCRIQAKGQAGRRWETDSYEFEASTKGKDLVLDATAENITPDRNIVVRLWDANSTELSTASNEAKPRFVSTVHEGHRYLGLRYPFQPGGGRKSRRDWVFLYEASADRDPVLARVQVDVIKTLLDNAERDDTFTILAASSRIRAFAEKPVAARAKQVKRAVEYLEKTQLVGALDLEMAFRAAAEVAEEAENPCLVHLGSAYPKLGEDDHDALVALLPEETTYVGVAVGNHWNRALMKRLAGDSGGYFSQINPNEPVTWKAIELMSRLNAPRLTNIRIVDDREKLTFLNMSDVVCQGEELFAVTRLDADARLPEFIEVNGRIDSESYSKSLPTQDIAAGADYLPRTWSKLEIDRMVAEDAMAHHDEIVDLSMAMYVMSPFTSLLVLENEQMYEQYNVDRGRKDHWALYPCPEKIEVVHEPLKAAPVQWQATDTAEPTFDEVLRTILLRRPPTWNRDAVPAVSVWQLDYAQRRLSSQWRFQQTGPPFQVFGRTIDGADSYEPLLRQWVNSDGLMDGTERPVIRPDGVEWGKISLNTSTWDFDNYQVRNTLDIDFDRSVTLGMTQPGMFSADLDIPFRRDDLGLNVIWHDGISYRPLTSLAFSGDLDTDYALLNTAGMADFNSDISLILATVTPEAWDTIWDVYPDFDLDIDLDVDRDVAALFRRTTSETILHQHSLLSDMYGIAGTLKARSINEINDAMALRVKRQKRVVDTLYQVERSHFPFPGKPPLIYPSAEVWRELSRRRGDRYRPMGLIARRSIWKTLDQPVSVHFERESLEDVIDFLSDHHNIHIEMIEPVMADPGGPVRNVNLKVDEIPLRVVLHRVLSPHNLSYIVTADNRILVIPETYALRLAPSVRNLLTYAPGMHTTRADVLAVLDAEAEIEGQPDTGRVDNRARRLIERSRRGGWHRLIVEEDSEHEAGLVFDGQGRYRIESKTTFDLKETTARDGNHLWHLYPELGIGAQRPASRFYGNTAQRLIPWLVPSADELALGADVVALDDRTLAVIPHIHTNPKRERGQPTHSPTTPKRQRDPVELRLVFRETGPLAERQLLRPDSDEILLRETYDADGTVRLFDAEGSERHNWVIATEACEAPDLQPDSSLVVLPLPWRTREHVFADRGLKDDGAHKNWSRDDALAVLAAETASCRDSMLSTVGWCFLAKGDRRPGFYTLLLAADVDWDTGANRDPYAVEHLFAPLEASSSDLITDYVNSLRQMPDDGKAYEIGPLRGTEDGFLRRLAKLHDLWLQWQKMARTEIAPEERNKLEGETVRLVNESKPLAFAASMLAAVAQYGGNEAIVRIGDKTETTLSASGPAAFRLRFLHARAVAETEEPDRGRQLLCTLVDDMLDAHIVPLIDPETKGTFFPNRKSADVWRRLAERIVEVTLEQMHGTRGLGVAIMLHDLGEHDQAEQILADTMTSASFASHGPSRLAAVSYLWQTDQRSRADAMLDATLSNDRYHELPSLWRLASAMAENQQRPARAAECLDRALSLEFTRLPEEIELRGIRTDYGKLLELLGEAVEASPRFDADVRNSLVSSIVGAADRWRSLDPQSTEACRQAGAALSRLGAVDLAWDYVTSPLVDDVEPATDWGDLAATYHHKGRYDLAQRAYELAIEADLTNADLLWLQARTLIEAGHPAEARQRLELLSNGTWDPKYRHTQEQAKQAFSPH